MPNQERIDSIIAQSEIEKEINFLSTNLDALTAKIKSFPGIKVSAEGANNVKELSKAQAQYAESLKAVDQLVKQRFASEAKLVTLQTDYAKATAANRLEIQKQNAELKAQAQYNAANTGSIEKARAAVKQLSAERDKLNLYTKEGRDRQEQLNASIDKYNAFIKKSVDAQAQQKINVGNYQGSALIIVEALEKEKKKLEELEKTRIRVQNAGAQFSPAASTNAGINRIQVTGFGGGNTGGLSIQANAATKEFQQLNTQIENSRKVIEGFSRVTEKPQFLNLAGKTSDATAELKTLTKSLIELERNGFGNTEGAKMLRAELAKLKDDISDTKAEIKALSSDTRGFDLFAGSVSFAADAFQTAAGAAVLFGASEEDAAAATKTLVAIQAVANGVKGIANELTTHGTAANKLYAAGQLLVATATDSSAAATTRLAAAGKLLLGVGLVAAIAFLVIKLREYKAAQDELNKSSEDLIEINKKGLENATEEIAKSKILYEASQNQNLSMKDRKAAVDELQKAYPDYFKNISDEAILTGKAAEQYDLLTQSIIKTGQAQAAKAKITEISGEILDSLVKVEEANKRIENINTTGVAVQDKFESKTLASGNQVNAAAIRISVDQKDKDQAISAIKTLYADAYTAVDKGNARIQTLINAVGAKNLIDQFSDDGKDKGGKKKTEKIKKELDVEFEIYKVEQQRRLQLLSEGVDNDSRTYEQRLADLQDFIIQSDALINIQLEHDKKTASKDEIKVLEAKAAIDRETIAANSYKKLEELAKIHGAKETQLALSVAGDIRKATQKASDDIAARDKSDKEKALKAEADFAARKKSINEQLYDEIKQTLFKFVDDSIQKEVNGLDEKQRLLGLEKDRRINNINSLGLSEVERTKQIAAVEKQAAADNEKIEKRKRQLAVERARYQKAESIANIVQSTAQAVIGALRPDGFTPLPARIALASVIGAIGALQLARAISTPLPQYRKGTNNAKPGLSIVGEEGTELMIDRGKVSLTPNQPTLVNLSGGEKIIPANLTRDILNIIGFKQMQNMAAFAQIPVHQDKVSQALQQKMLGKLDEISSKTGIIINNTHGIETSAYYRKNMKE